MATESRSVSGMGSHVAISTIVASLRIGVVPYCWVESFLSYRVAAETDELRVRLAHSVWRAAPNGSSLRARLTAASSVALRLRARSLWFSIQTLGEMNSSFIAASVNIAARSP